MGLREIQVVRETERLVLPRKTLFTGNFYPGSAQPPSRLPVRIKT
jgi:hypothetical protein